MERERWLELSQAISEVAGRWKESKTKYKHPTALIVRVYAWAAAHDRPVSWACEKDNWEPRNRPEQLPDQSTMSRRTRGGGDKHGQRFWRFCEAVGKRLAARPGGSWLALKLRRLDGKSLTVAAHSTDRDAAWGRGAGQRARGYKLHAIWSDSPMPDQWCVTPLNVVEKRMAKRLIPRLAKQERQSSCGY